MEIRPVIGGKLNRQSQCTILNLWTSVVSLLLVNMYHKLSLKVKVKSHDER
jgi:hypothetical protein